MYRFFLGGGGGVEGGCGGGVCESAHKLFRVFLFLHNIAQRLNGTVCQYYFRRHFKISMSASVSTMAIRFADDLVLLNKWKRKQ